MVEINEQNIYDHIVQGNDKEVIKFLYKRTFPIIKNSLLRKKATIEDIEDVFQDAVMILYKMIISNKILASRNICGLVHTIAVHRWYNLKRKNNRQQLFDFQQDDTYQSLSEDFNDLIFAKTEKNLLRSLFSKIGQKCLELLSFTIYQDLLMEDIQHRMGFRSEAATKMQMKRCREKLFEQIENNPEILNRLLEHV